MSFRTLEVANSKAERVNIIFILPRTTDYSPVVWVRLVAFTKLRHPQKGTRQGLVYSMLVEATTK